MTRRSEERLPGSPLRLGLTAAALCLVILGAPADAADRPLHFGARADAPPMSYRSEDGQFRGYAIDICDSVKKVYRELYPEREIAEGYVEVTATDRQDKLLNGEIDTVCGAFSITQGRMKDYDFSFLIFASGASVAARRSVAPVLSVAEDEKKVKEPAGVAVVSDTTTQALVEELLGTSVSMQLKATHAEAFAALAKGEVQYYFGDRDILRAVVGRADNAEDFQVGGKFLTYEPYALPFAKGKNPELLQAANIAIARMYRSRQINSVYERHFTGQRPSALLQSLYQLYALPE